MRRFLPVLLLLTLLAWPVVAGGHERRTLGSAFTERFAGGAAEQLMDARALADPQPLTGGGSNMRIVANVPMESFNGVAASDLELAGDHAYVGSYGEGMVIVDISNPLDPKRAGVFPCPGGQNDIQLQPGSNPQYAVMAIESTSNKCHPQNEGFVLIDISDKANPREVAFVGQGANEGKVEDGAHNTTMSWPYLFVDQYLPTHGDNGKVDIFDLRRLIANPADREPLKIFATPGGGTHDLQVDRRPDGRVLGYGASIGFTDVFDLTDVMNPKILQRFSAAEHGVGISHGAEPNFDRTLMIESDEYGGGSGVGACGGADDARVPAPAGTINTGSPGAVHFLRLNQDGTIRTLAPGKVDQIGAYNIPVQNNPSENEGCTSHVFWQAPDENRMVIAWYGRGTRVFDFADPAKPVEVGHFIPTDSETWSAKPHKGYIFTGDTVRGMDVLEYTGEACERWPKTSGAAEVQRARYQGTTAPAESPAKLGPGCGGRQTDDPARPLVSGEADSAAAQQPAQSTPAATPAATPAQQPAAPATVAPRLGGYRFVRAVRVPRSPERTQVVRLQVRNRAGKVVARRSFRVRSGRIARLRVAVGGPAGLYSYRVLAGRRTLRKGSFLVKSTSRVRVAGASATTVRLGTLR